MAREGEVLSYYVWGFPEPKPLENERKSQLLHAYDPALK
jgi:hypothetical protein